MERALESGGNGGGGGTFPDPLKHVPDVAVLITSDAVLTLLLQYRCIWPLDQHATAGPPPQRKDPNCRDANIEEQK